ncbi:MAG: Sapep family Mn(2+)-dependent dipeptidase [Oscillospiraceae bacterium]
MNQTSYKKEIEAYFADKEPALIAAISRLVAIRSVKEAPAAGAPFGPGPAACLNEALQLASDLGFAVQNHEGYVGTADLNDKETAVHILGHLDVVGEGTGWTVTEPYAPKLVDGMLYGRGTDDDKGPLIAALFAMKAVKDLGLPLTKNARLIMGTDEESGSEDIAYYYNNHPFAPYAFSPDADFPLINIEKGSYKPTFSAQWSETAATPRVSSIGGPFRINVVPAAAEAVVTGMTPAELAPYFEKATAKTGVTFTATPGADGKTAIRAAGQGGHAASPEEANNALTGLISMLSSLPLANIHSTVALRALSILFPHGDYYGKAIGVAQKDDISGPLTLVLSMMDFSETGFSGRFDSRVPLCGNEENCKKVAQAAFKAYEFTCIGDMDAPHHTEAESPFVKTLLKCYEEYTGNTNSKPLAIGGGTYVHDIPGGVAFGCGMPGFVSNLHGPDEHARVADLMTSAKIFTQAIAQLCS